MDVKTNFYWEYGEIAKNVLADRGFSFYYISNDSLDYRFNPDINPFPSALMAPGYVGFLLPFMEISNNIIRNVLILLTQIIITLVTIFFLFKFTERYFSQLSAVFAGVVASISPDFVYSVISFTPTVLYQCMIIALMAVLYKRKNDSKKADLLMLAVLFSALIYIRYEFSLFVLIYCSLLFIYKRWKYSMILIGLTFILLFPWVIRNTFVFNQFIPLSTGFGLNFYRGNNAEELGSWGNDHITKEIPRLPRNQSFEVSLSQLYYNEAVKYIKQKPFEEISNLPRKLSHLWIISTLQERSNNWLHQITSWFVFIFFIIGLLSTFSWHNHKYLYVFLIYSTIIALVFFSVPRHQTMMRIALLPIVGAGLEYIYMLIKKLKLHPK
jgi:hypothetical protein